MTLDDLENFISGMKSREADERKLSEETLIRAITIQRERMKLEDYARKCANRDTQKEEAWCPNQ